MSGVDTPRILKRSYVFQMNYACRGLLKRSYVFQMNYACKGILKRSYVFQMNYACRGLLKMANPMTPELKAQSIFFMKIIYLEFYLSNL